MTNFEVRQYDAAGRTGEFTVPRAGVTVETPALLPVVNPHVQTVQPATLETDFGAEILITNSYILHGSDELRDPALEEGLHDLLDFSGAIMTDSGSFQLAEYGDIDVTTAEILRFQAEIGSDVGTPVDVPTPPDVDRERAEAELERTQTRLERARDVDVGEMLVSAPVQGSTHLDLRERAGAHAAAVGLDVFPIGAVVPLLNDYRFADVVDVVAAAKRGLGEVGPVHLFGAGHPMMFALAVAMGCDLFDSAAYALYARDERYLTVRGTEHLADLEQFPCACPVCTEHAPTDLRGMADERTQDLLARHNLHVSFAEVRRIRQAIRQGDLLELVETRARGHPDLVDGYRALLDRADHLERTDPATKDTFFYLSADSARRPEVRRYHERLDRFDPAGPLLVTAGSPSEADAEGFDEVWGLRPPFGPFPPELAEMYPLTAQVPDRLGAPAFEAAAEGVATLAEANPDLSITLVHDGWPATALERVPDGVTIRRRVTE